MTGYAAWQSLSARATPLRMRKSTAIELEELAGDLHQIQLHQLIAELL